MNVTAGGVNVPISDPLEIAVTVNGNETLPQVDIVVTGGTLDVYKSKVRATGVNLHLFGAKGAEQETPWRWAMSFIQSLDFVTQSAHMGWGGFMTMILALFMPWYCALFTFSLLWVLPKEMIFDNLSWGEGHGSPDYIDATFYTLGQVLACAALILFK